MVVIATMQGEHSNQSSFFGMIYEDLIPADHLLRQLAAAVDFGFVSDLVSDCYCPTTGGFPGTRIQSSVPTVSV